MPGPARIATSIRGPNLSGYDTATRRVVRLFDPRRQRWARHFAWDGPVLVGLTPTGRVTIHVLAMNKDEQVRLRRQLMDEGDWLGD